MFLFENLVAERSRRPTRRRGRSHRRLGRRGLAWRRRGRGLALNLRWRLNFDATRFECRGQVLLGLDEALLLSREPFPLRCESRQLLTEDLLQFDKGFVLRGRLLLAGVHFLADLQHLPLPTLAGVGAFVLQLDQLLFPLCPLLSAG